VRHSNLRFFGLNRRPVDELGPAHFQLTTEDYLHACISLNAELARFCVNSVTNSNYAMPRRISTFCKELAAGFGSVLPGTASFTLIPWQIAKPKERLAEAA
jgi:hypothetical protein